MMCPRCDGKTKVVCTIPKSNGRRRYRKCLVCDYRFTTAEIVVKKEATHDD